MLGLAIVCQLGALVVRAAHRRAAARRDRARHHDAPERPASAGIKPTKQSLIAIAACVGGIFIFVTIAAFVRDRAAGHRPAADHDPDPARRRDVVFARPVDLAAQAHGRAVLHHRRRRDLRLRRDPREGRHHAHPGRRLRVAHASSASSPCSSAPSSAPTSCRPRTRRARPTSSSPASPSSTRWSPILIGLIVLQRGRAAPRSGSTSRSPSSARSPCGASSSSPAITRRSSATARSCRSSAAATAQRMPRTRAPGRSGVTEAVAKVWPDPPVKDKGDGRAALSVSASSSTSMTMRPSSHATLVAGRRRRSRHLDLRLPVARAPLRPTAARRRRSPRRRRRTSRRRPRAAAADCRASGAGRDATPTTARPTSAAAMIEPGDRVHERIVPCAG